MSRQLDGAVEGNARDRAQTTSDLDTDAVRRSRRHPRPTQFDYLHLKRLLDDLSTVTRRLHGPLRVLDVYCGTRPYDDLLPPEAACIGLDVDGRYGVADVVTSEFLPFADDSFDVVLCIEAFHYVADPRQGVAEIRRVLRPGGRAIVTVPLAWEYDRAILEHRFTGPELAALFADWEGVEVIENGGYAVSWATLTGRIVNLVETRWARHGPLTWIARPLFAGLYVVINLLGIALDRVERVVHPKRLTFPMNLLITAVDAGGRDA